MYFHITYLHSYLEIISDKHSIKFSFFIDGYLKSTIETTLNSGQGGQFISMINLWLDVPDSVSWQAHVAVIFVDAFQILKHLESPKPSSIIHPNIADFIRNLGFLTRDFGENKKVVIAVNRLDDYHNPQKVFEEVSSNVTKWLRTADIREAKSVPVDAVKVLLNQVNAN